MRDKKYFGVRIASDWFVPARNTPGGGLAVARQLGSLPGRNFSKLDFGPDGSRQVPIVHGLLNGLEELSGAIGSYREQERELSGAADG